ncbi:hypothetical protein IQ274_14210 [Nostoc sp. LEGE 12447]|uniref:hypothetical protein n=1 Tax=Nostoc sp. LEGE 12447 TaxID=1828640 RepID=UPI0018837D79|nr:hypothetical protein [Nostoc sp. LEGE 12447]MBE8999343.1 hypothetical protein [Nostoc sp. LEGE 12447]
MSQKRKSLFLKWMYLVSDINNFLPNSTALACPNCYQLGVDFQYVGDLQTKIGYMVIWCPFCLQGIHISRVSIPDQAQALSFNLSPEKILKRIPNFTLVKPDY